MKKLPKHDCSSFVKKAYLALDGELSKEEMVEFLKDIERCSACLENYQIEKSFKEFLVSKICRKHIPPSLKHNIRQRISI